MLLDAGQVDAALCGGSGDWTRQLHQYPADHSAPARRQPALFPVGA